MNIDEILKEIIIEGMQKPHTLKDLLDMQYRTYRQRMNFLAWRLRWR